MILEFLMQWPLTKLVPIYIFAIVVWVKGILSQNANNDLIAETQAVTNVTS